ncbi:sensor histidine kinase [Ruminiclostridium cellulolyticum]|uniref:histidine kinase n=1 Tax=Ruminiclostridium cellulolyticum (strain ATCC 35319 / DSM 5812 / JCM 6584 / H10) TaxID=394503 RepID=B8I011_RUMCH|nr:HAMP domain-containing sensor histidine kinase [Ruminiclostridium cellulolyticum]ACL75511.1 histidine kinase [Ruminiclostridium cellulolyticum H10]
MKLLKNKEIQLTIGIITVLIIALGAVSYYTVRNFVNYVNKTQIQQNTVAIGAIVKQYPHLESDIVKNYTKGFKEDYEYGKSILKKYSYDENLGVEKNYILENSFKKAYTRIKITIVGFWVVLVLFCVLSFNRIFSKIRKISVSAEAIVEGNYDSIKGDTQEGDIGYLIYQINCMSERLSENVHALENEKIFLKRIMADISHQLKTPLASLIMFNDIMKNDSSLSEEERAGFVLESKNQLDRMEWLIKNILKMAKLEAGVVEFSMEEADISETVQRSLSPLKTIAAEKNVDIRLNGSSGVIVNHDINWTTEAFSNIIKNCIEHSSKGGDINISWDENNVFVQIIIEDEGQGIPKDELSRIFDRFYKGSYSCNPTNIGIGLYITKTIVEGQNGSIYVSSTHGKGTRFTVRLMKNPL